MMKKSAKGVVMALLLAGMTAGAVYAQSEGGEPTGGDVQALLLPIIAAATVVERLIEVIFDWYESAIMNLSKFPGLAADYVGWAQQQVRESKAAFREGMTAAEVSRAEQALKDAQDRIASFVKNPQYLSIKRAYAMILGFVFGLIIAFSVEGLAIFELLGLGLPETLTWMDKLITGLLIGTGSAPMHSLIGLLQNSKDAVDSARALWKGEALLNAIEFEETAEEIRQLKQNQTWMTERFMSMADAGEEGNAAALPEPLPMHPEAADTPVQAARRAERLLAK